MKKLIFSFVIIVLAIPQISLAVYDNDNTCDANLVTPVVSATENDNSITLSWEEINHDDLNGYKVVISKEDEAPVYPANGYLKWITNTSITSQEINNLSSYKNGDFGYYFEEGEDYYFSITAVYGCGEKVAGNVLHLTYPGDSIACTADVKECPDGTYVSRVAPSCNFAECPNNNDTNDNYDDSEDTTTNVSHPVPVVTAQSEETGVKLSWNKINDDRFTGYKVVVSKSTKNPKYPDHGYARYITNSNTTSFLLDNSSEYVRGDFGGFLKPGEDYYFSITALYGNVRVAGNSIELVYNGPGHNVKPEPKKDPIVVYKEKAKLLRADGLGDILAELKELRDIVKEQQNEIKYLRSLIVDFKDIAQNVQDSLNNFITYGVDENTQKLGAGERAAVIYSFKSAFKKLPETDEEMADAIKIANGRWPSKTNEAAEHRAKIEFKKIYLRDADMSNPNDNAAVTVMAYGLRQKAENRNLDSEREGIKTFKYIYGSTPDSTEDWNIMQAITYSGATR